jgi:hypothetical protein
MTKGWVMPVPLEELKNHSRDRHVPRMLQCHLCVNVFQWREKGREEKSLVAL